MNFMFSLAENNDIELYNRDVKKSVLDHYGDKTRFCLNDRVAERRGFGESFKIGNTLCNDYDLKEWENVRSIASHFGINNTHHFMQDRWILYIRYQSGAILSTSQGHCKRQRKYFLTPPTSNMTITT